MHQFIRKLHLHLKCTGYMMGIEGSGDREIRCGHGLPSVVLCGWNRFTIVCRNTGVLATLPPIASQLPGYFQGFGASTEIGLAGLLIPHGHWKLWKADPDHMMRTNGCRRYSDKSGKACFQLVSQVSQPKPDGTPSLPIPRPEIVEDVWRWMPWG